MATGYTRQSAGSIITGATIQASHFNAEYNAVESAFNVSTGHNHDGTTGGGAPIPTAGMSGLTSTSAGIVCGTGSNSLVVRTLTAPAAGITVSNGTGASGNPTLALADDLAALEAMSSTGLVTRTASNTYAQRTITAGTNISVTNGDGVSGNPTISLSGLGSSIQAYDAGLAALAAFNTNGILVQTADNTFAGRTLTGTADKITVTNGDGVSGNPTATIASTYAGQTSITTLGTIATGTWDATTIAIGKGGTGQTTATAAFNALAPSQTSNSGKFLTTDGTNTSWATIAAGFTDPGSNGVVVRTALNTSTARTITGTANEITVTNGDGVSGNPTISLPTALTFTGKTITGGTWNGNAITVSYGGTGLSSATAYAVLCGGTTSTGALQSVASVGTSGQVLTSNGAGALPTFQTISAVTSVATGAGLTGGPITSTGTISINTNNSLGVGSYAILKNKSGSAVANGGTVTTTSGQLQAAKWSSSDIVSWTNINTGTWRNVTGLSLSTDESGMWIRTA